MAKSTLDEIKVCLLAGHSPEAGSEPEWTGNLWQFWENNQSLTFGEIREAQKDLAYRGYTLIGGGAQGCYTLCTPEHAKRILEYKP